MCGIIGLVSTQPVLTKLLSALEKMEYRGYDSSGLATYEGDHIQRVRAVGTVAALREKVPPLQGVIGIGHTRWATHGTVHELNAHPHMSKGVAVVHNGIIENFAALKGSLLAQDYEFESETDTEVIAHLLSQTFAETQDIHATMTQVLPQLEGSFALVCLFEAHPDRLVIARQGSSPLAVGYGEGEMAISSDALGLKGLAESMSYLDEGNWGVVYTDHVDFFTFAGEPLAKEVVSNPVLSLNLERGHFKHYMLKEIHEQSMILSRLDQQKDSISLKDIEPFAHATFLGCGTAFYASWLGKLYWEKVLRIPVTLELASEFHYRRPPMLPGLTVAVSQSGETADTLKAAEYAKRQGQKLLSVVNVPQSSLARLSDYVFYTQAGPEIGVASTKAFITQIWVLLMLAAEEKHPVRSSCQYLPVLMEQTFLLVPRIQETAKMLSTVQHIFYLGRGLSYPLALEGALKMKELAYIHAEGMPSGELKHGPLALIDDRMSIILLAPYDDVFDKTLSNLHEIIARSGRVTVLTDERGYARMGGICVHELIVLPTTPDLLTPFVYTLVMQLLAYYTAFYKGVTIDKPRHLAKCVTVE